VRGVGAAFFPLDKRLGIPAGLYSRGMAHQMVWLSGLLPYEQCVEVLGRVGGYTLNTSSIWRRTQTYGAKLLAQAQQEQANVSPERLQMAPAWADHAQVKGASMDGGMVNIRQQGWKEMKVGAIYDVVLRLEYDKRIEEYADFAHADNIAYTAVLGDVAHFAPALWALAVDQQMSTAQTSSVTSDGADWIWNLADDLFPDSRQIVDWFHACQHLADAASALFPNAPDAAARWYRARQDDLFLGNIAAITSPLDHANLSAFSHYFHTHQRRMQYQEFREEGFPIGSGSVECTVKQFKTRLTGPGMRWNPEPAQRMLLLRAAVLDGSFDARWQCAA
jgi:hypothetical protein